MSIENFTAWLESSDPAAVAIRDEVADSKEPTVFIRCLRVCYHIGVSNGIDQMADAVNAKKEPATRSAS